VLIANQVYSNFDEREKFNMVGGDIMTYSSKCLIELKPGPDGTRIAVLKKHRSLPERKIAFKITEKGIEKVKGKIFGVI